MQCHLLLHSYPQESSIDVSSNIPPFVALLGNIHAFSYPPPLEEESHRSPSQLSQKELDKKVCTSVEEIKWTGSPSRTGRCVEYPNISPGVKRFIDRAQPPVVTSPSTGLSGSFSELKRCLEDQERRRTNLIPPHVNLAPQTSDKSLLSALPVYEDIVRDAPFLPFCHREIREIEEPATTSSPTKPERVPSWPKEAHYPQELAGKYMSNSSSSKSRSQESSGFSTSRRIPTSNIASRRHSDTNARGMPVCLASLDYPHMEKMHSRPQLCRPQGQADQGRDIPIVDVVPGLSVPLRGSVAAKAAVAHHWITAISCFGCAADIHCIADVSYTICPHCRIISPVDEKFFQGEEMSRRWGLGLGFTDDDLFLMQMEVAMARSTAL